MLALEVPVAEQHAGRKLFSIIDETRAVAARYRKQEVVFESISVQPCSEAPGCKARALIGRLALSSRAPCPTFGRLIAAATASYLRRIADNINDLIEMLPLLGGRRGSCFHHLRLFPARNIRNMGHVLDREPIEEQTLARYSRKQYRPTRIEEVLNNRYRIIAKLGFGAYSTVWLARDQQ